MEALRGVQVEGAVLVTTPQVGFCWLSELKKNRSQFFFLFGASELQELEVLFHVQPNFPIMIQILLKGFHQFLKSRGPNTRVIRQHQAVAVGDVRRELTFCRKTGLKVCHIKLVISLMIWKGAWYCWKHEWLCLSTLLHLHQCLFEWGWQSSCGTCQGGKYIWDIKLHPVFNHFFATCRYLFLDVCLWNPSWHWLQNLEVALWRNFQTPR